MERCCKNSGREVVSKKLPYHNRHSLGTRTMPKQYATECHTMC
uniref:Uncharacterized protein n=1 Tax=Anguilla anguilla TaxID=7936 RepID=A0A0E9R6X3_ANGAN